MSYSQDKILKFQSSRCLLSCGAEFSYKSEISLLEDMLLIKSQLGEVVSHYKIISKDIQLRSPNNGKIKIKAMSIEDSSIKDFRFVIRKGQGKLYVMDNGLCQMNIDVEVSPNF
jgi:hypothetical protein